MPLERAATLYARVQGGGVIDSRLIPLSELGNYERIPLHGYAWPAPPRASFGRLAWSLLVRAVAVIGGRR